MAGHASAVLHGPPAGPKGNAEESAGPAMPRRCLSLPVHVFIVLWYSVSGKHNDAVSQEPGPGAVSAPAAGLLSLRGGTEGNAGAAMIRKCVSMHNMKPSAKKLNFGAKSRVFAVKPCPVRVRLRQRPENFCGIT